MKDVRYSETTRQAKETYSLLHQTTNRLEEVLGKAADSTEAEWDRTEDATGRPVFTLRILDRTDEAKTTFEPQELTEPTHVRVRLLQLWGNLLRERNHRLLRNYLATTVET